MHRWASMIQVFLQDAHGWKKIWPALSYQTSTAFHLSSRGINLSNPQAKYFRMKKNYLVFLIFCDAINARYCHDLHLSTFPGVKKNFSMEINSLWVFTKLWLNLVNVVKTILVGVRIGKSEKGCLSWWIWKKMLEVKNKLLCRCTRNLTPFFIVWCCLSRCFLILKCFGVYRDQWIVELSCDALPIFLLFRHDSVHWPQALRVKLRLLKLVIIFNLPDYSNSWS